MQGIYIGNNLIKLDRIDSTNNYLTELLISQHLHEGTVVVANNQDGGRGQRGTQWESEAGKNLTLSILLKPFFLSISKQFELSKIAALAVMDMIKLLLPNHQNDVRIKWPNDVYVSKNKISGILIENTILSNTIAYSIIGIGVNINQENFSRQIKMATSVNNIAGKEFDLDFCREQLCICLDKRYKQLKSNSSIIQSDYLNNLMLFNEWATYIYNDETIKAMIKDVNAGGKLVLEKEDSATIECDIKQLQLVL